MIQYIFASHLILVLLLAVSAEVDAADKVKPPTPNSLTLNQAVQLALDNHPELRESQAKINAAQSRAVQAGAFPNPEAIVRMESAPIQGRTIRNAEYVAGISQSLPVGGRLSAAKKAASAEAGVAQQEFEIKKFEIKKRVQAAFGAALYAQDYAQLLSKSLSDTETALQLTRARLENGDTLPEESTRMEVEVLLAKREIDTANQLLQSAQLSIANLIGTSSEHLPPLIGNLEDALSIHEIEEAVNGLHLYVKAAEADVAAQQARLKQAQREHIPDVNVDLLYRRLGTERKDGFNVGIRVPIPVFGGARARAREVAAEASAAEARLDSVRNEVLTRRKQGELNLQTALMTTRMLADQIIPRSNTILNAAHARYEAGDISLSEFLPLQRFSLGCESVYLFH